MLHLITVITKEERHGYMLNFGSVELPPSVTLPPPLLSVNIQHEKVIYSSVNKHL